jgi:predicted Zn-dependent protease
LTVARYQRAITFRAAEDFEAAVADLRIVVAEEPSNKDALDQLGTLLIALGEEKEGQEFLRRVFESTPMSTGK